MVNKNSTNFSLPVFPINLPLILKPLSPSWITLVVLNSFIFSYNLTRYGLTNLSKDSSWMLSMLSNEIKSDSTGGKEVSSSFSVGSGVSIISSSSSVTAEFLSAAW